MNGMMLIVGRSLRQHAFSTIVTALAVALASGLLMAVFSIKAQSFEAFTGGATGFDAVLGARGSQLQLVLNSVFHLDTSPGNIPWKMYQAMKNDPRVKLAVPYAVGDNYHGFRIVGTTPDIYKLYEYKRSRKFELESGGRFFNPTAREAVIGSFAAKQTGLKIGDVFSAYHGIVFDENMKHPGQFTVVGILKPTNTPSDRVVWIPIDAFYRMSGHVLRGNDQEYVAKENESIPDDNKEISAVMLKFGSPQAGFMFDQTINRQGKVATIAWPIGKTMAEFFNKIGWFNKILNVLAYLIVLVAGASILAGVYNSMNERRREFAILRALGAKRTVLFSVIVLESSTIAAIGMFFGYLHYIALVGVSSIVIQAQTGVVIDVLRFHPVFILAPVGIILVGALAGIIPAYKAYQSDVAENLVPTS